MDLSQKPGDGDPPLGPDLEGAGDLAGGHQAVGGRGADAQLLGGPRDLFHVVGERDRHVSHPSPRVAVVVSAMWPPAGRIGAECPSSSFMIRNQRHPQRHPHRNCLVRRYGESRQEGPSGRQFRRSHQIGAGVWTISVPLWRSRSGESSRRPWRARCPPGRLSRSPAPMPPFRTIVTTSGQRARAPQRRSPVGLGTSRCPARCRGTTDGTCGEPSSCTWSLLAASRVPATPTAMVALDRAVDVGWGAQPRRPDINRWEPNATPRRGGQGSERSESEKRRPDGEARNEPTRRVTNRAGASERRP